MTTGDFDPFAEATPSLPAGQPGGYQAPEDFSVQPAFRPPGAFDRTAPLQGGRSRQRFGPETAGLPIRGVARLVDGVLCVILAQGIAPRLPFVQGTPLGDGTVVDSSGAQFVQMLNAISESVILGLVLFVYFVVFESVFGWTPGKKMFGLSVHAISRPGSPKPSIGQAARRNSFLLVLLWPIPYFSFLFLIISCLLTAMSIFNSGAGQSKRDIGAQTEVMKG